MLDRCFQFPQSAEYGRVIAKNKIYDKAKSSTELKSLLTRQAEQIRWCYKLATTTINLPESNGIQEIQIITIDQKGMNLDEKILQALDRSIPSPLIFELKWHQKIRYAASYKRPSEAIAGKWVNSTYFYSPWLDANSEPQTIPIVLSIGTLYESLLQELMPLPKRDNEQMQDLVDRTELWLQKCREANLLEKRRDRQKQFKRKVELNQAYNALLAEIEALACTTAETKTENE